jgi:hypothetical protein
MGMEHIQRRISKSATNVEGEVLSFNGIKSFQVCLQIYKCSKSVSFLYLRPLTLLQFRCPHCQGQGRQITRLCPKCSGQKVIDTQNTLAVHIPAGAPEGFEEVFHGEADESMEWEAGDVVVRVRSRRGEGEGGWGRKQGGILGRVTLSVAEVRSVDL